MGADGLATYLEVACDNAVGLAFSQEPEGVPLPLRQEFEGGLGNDRLRRGRGRQTLRA